MKYLPLLMLAACQTPQEKVLDAVEATYKYSYANVRKLHGKTACRPAGGVNPYFYTQAKLPIAGTTYKVTWVTTAAPPRPVSLAWIMFSTKPNNNPLDFTAMGAYGCWLLVNPDTIVQVNEGMNGPIFYRERGSGLIDMQLRLTDAMIGQSLYFQLLVAAPEENRLGLLVSPGLQITVGREPVNRRQYETDSRRTT